MANLEVGLTLLANNVAKGDLKALKLALPLRERAQEQEVFHNPPVIQVNFVKPKNGRPLREGEEEDEN